MRVPALALLFGLLAALGSSVASAQTCAPPDEQWGDPWPAEVQVPGMDGEVDGSVSLSRADGEAIRCALVASLRSNRVRALSADLRAQVRRRRVGPIWLDQGRPRIDSFWLQHLEDGSIELSDTLVMTDRVRTSALMKTDPPMLAKSDPCVDRDFIAAG